MPAQQRAGHSQCGQLSDGNPSSAEGVRRGARQATVAYYLMQDNRRRMPSSAYLRAELSEASDAAHSYPSGAHPRHWPCIWELYVLGAVSAWTCKLRAVLREAAT